MVEQNLPYSIYSILDASRIFGETDHAQSLQTNFLSLYMGQSEELLSSVAPYLFSYQPDSEFGKWLLDKGWGNSWGMYVETHAAIDDLRKHFRKFLVVKTEEGKELYFRFFDPRVLRVFLPTCNEQQLADFFGPIKMFAMETEDADYAIEFEIHDGRLVSRKIPKQEFWSSLNNLDRTKFSESAATPKKAPAIISRDLEDQQSEIYTIPEEPKREPEKISIETTTPTQRKWSFMVE